MQIQRQASTFAFRNSEQWRIAMAWEDWKDKIEHNNYPIGNRENFYQYRINHGPDEHGENRGSFLDYWDGGPRGLDPGKLHISLIAVDPNFQRQGIAEALMRRLAEDHPDHKIDPGGMTEDGWAFHDRMLEKEPKAKSVLAQRLFLAMAWQDWKDKIKGTCESCRDGSEGRYVIPEAGAYLDFFHANRPEGKPEIGITGIYTHPSNRKDGVAESLMRKLVEDHPGATINPGYMTRDGQAFHDRLMKTVPEASDIVQQRFWRIALDYHGPHFGEEEVADKPYEWKLHDLIPTDLNYRKTVLENDRTINGPTVPNHSLPELQTGKWYHISPNEYEPGDKITPPGQQNKSKAHPWFYTKGNENRRNYVWVEPSLTKIKDWDQIGWAEKNNRSYIYEVYPGDHPQRYNLSNYDGWVAPHAVVKRRVR